MSVVEPVDRHVDTKSGLSYFAGNLTERNLRGEKYAAQR